jgi:endoglucanase
MAVARMFVAAFAAVAAVGTAAPPAHAATSLTCSYRLYPFTGGFIAELAIANSGPTIDGWTARWTFPAPTTILAVWQARMFQPDATTVTATDLVYNRTISAGAQTVFGWSGTAATIGVPTDVTVNGIAC